MDVIGSNHFLFNKVPQNDLAVKTTTKHFSGAFGNIQTINDGTMPLKSTDKSR